MSAHDQAAEEDVRGKTNFFTPPSFCVRVPEKDRRAKRKRARMCTRAKCSQEEKDQGRVEDPTAGGNDSGDMDLMKRGKPLSRRCHALFVFA